MITKDRFIEMLQTDGSDFIGSCKIWLKSDFSYFYNVKKRDLEKMHSDNGVWESDSLLSACKKYSWKGMDKKTTDYEINKIRGNICASFKSKDEEKFVRDCIDVMEWGGVHRQNGLSLLKLYLDDNLIKMISDAYKVLVSEAPDLSLFKSNKYVMTSGFSKVYSLLEKEKVYIYDSRVASGLGVLLLKHYSDFNKIPRELRFPRPESQTTDRVVVFNDFYEGKNKKELQCKQPGFSSNYEKYAEWNIKFNWFLEYLVLGEEFMLDIDGELHLTGMHDKMLAVEQALFMIGYRFNSDAI